MNEAADLTPELEAYQQRVAKLRNSPYMDWPAHIHLETLAQCNAACSFCPYPSLDRKGAKMSDQMLDKVLKDLEEIPRILPFQLSPFKVNEPFLDVRLFDILDRVQERLSNANITLTTNASPLTEDKLRRLAGYPQLASLWISFNDHRPEQYEATMQLPFKRTRERLDMIHTCRASGLLKVKVYLSRVSDGSIADQEFVNWVSQHYPLFEPSLFPRGEWLGQTDSSAALFPPIPQVGCARWFDLSITATGVVAHCCMDGQAAYPIGNVADNHLLEIYNAPHYRSLRERALTRITETPCAQCHFL